jgi:hypothetical protein
VPTTQTTRGIANGRWEPPAPRSLSAVLRTLGRIGVDGLAPKALLAGLEKGRHWRFGPRMTGSQMVDRTAHNTSRPGTSHDSGLFGRG